MKYLKVTVSFFFQYTNNAMIASSILLIGAEYANFILSHNCPTWFHQLNVFHNLKLCKLLKILKSVHCPWVVVNNWNTSVKWKGFEPLRPILFASFLLLLFARLFNTRGGNSHSIFNSQTKLQVSLFGHIVQNEGV